MSVWVVEAELALILSVLVAPLALPAYIAFEYRNHGRFSPWNAVLGGVTLLYALAIPAFTLLPLPPSTYCDTSDGVIHLQLNPLASFANVAGSIADIGLASTLSTGVFLEVLFNIVFFIPLGFLLTYRFSLGLGRTVLAGLLLSLAIELTQGTGVWGLADCPYRLADVDDLITNTTGAGLGWFLGRWLAPHLPNPNPPLTDDLSEPGLLRRSVAWTGDVAANILLGLGLLIGVRLTINGVEPWVETSLGTVLPVIILQLVVPSLRRDSATPGKITTWLAVMGMHGATNLGQNMVRFAVRWLGFCVAVYWSVPLALGLLLVPDLITVVIRNDRQSLSGRLSKTETKTRRSTKSSTTPQ